MGERELTHLLCQKRGGVKEIPFNTTEDQMLPTQPDITRHKAT